MNFTLGANLLEKTARWCIPAYAVYSPRRSAGIIPEAFSEYCRMGRRNRDGAGVCLFSLAQQKVKPLFRWGDGRNDQRVAWADSAGHDNFPTGILCLGKTTRIFPISQNPGVVAGLQCVLRIFGDRALPGAVRTYATVVVNDADEGFLHRARDRQAGDREEKGGPFHPVLL
jgi:hypothetical protein